MIWPSRISNLSARTRPGATGMAAGSLSTPQATKPSGLTLRRSRGRSSTKSVNCTSPLSSGPSPPRADSLAMPSPLSSPPMRTSLASMVGNGTMRTSMSPAISTGRPMISLACASKTSR